MRESVCVAMILFGVLAFPSLVAGAQEPASQDNAQTTAKTPLPSPSPNDVARRIRALRITEPIKIDGRLDEAAWSQADTAKDFRQQEPVEGTLATEETEVRFFFDEENFYVGIHAFD
ncbi:MAG: hypothetical protein ACREA9_19050, partial [Pyrinomonadaceae bacterium]